MQLAILGFGFWQYLTARSQWVWIAVTVQTMVLLLMTWNFSRNRTIENDDTRNSTAMRWRVWAGSIPILFSVGLAATVAGIPVAQAPLFHSVQYCCHSMLNLIAMIALRWCLYTEGQASEQNQANGAEVQLSRGRSRRESTDSLVRDFRPALGRSDYQLRSLASTLHTASSSRSLALPSTHI